ncbi:MAG: RICIN domain-containing protein [Streptosporangiaceae bacterium]
MRKPGRLLVALAVSALVAVGAVTAGLVASASTDVGATCDGSASATGGVSCQIDDASPNVALVNSITLVVTLESGDGQNNQDIEVSWQGFCYENGGEDFASITSSPTPTPKTPISTGTVVSFNLALPYAPSRACEITATAVLVASLGGGTYDANTTGSWQMQMEYTPYVSPTATAGPSPSGVTLIEGSHSMCLDDKANSSANRTEVIIWTCDHSDPAQGWKFTKGELVHDGKCANDRANGGSGTKVILWTCDRAPDETWTHTGSDGEFVLTSRTHGQLCLTDPGYSRTNRTQLTVSACRNTSNQHWR